MLKKTASRNVIFKTFKMKFSLKNIFAFLALAFFVVSCRTSDSDEIIPTTNTELDGFLKIKEITNETHIIELYSKTGKTQLGYNDLRLRIKNKSTNQYEKAANVKWTPLMNMATMSHSCPKSALQKVSSNSNVYGGYLVFQMPENEMEGWTLKVDYSIGASDYSATGNLKVPASTKKNADKAANFFSLVKYSFEFNILPAKTADFIIIKEAGFSAENPTFSYHDQFFAEYIPGILPHPPQI